MNWEHYIQALFNPGDHVCASDDVYGRGLMRVEHLQRPTQFITINAHQPGTRRSDDNVTCFRNFLLEMDEASLEEQADYIERQLKVPFTTKVYSGGKSYHYVLSLEEPLQSAEEYRQVAQWLCDLAPKIDPRCRNPSRFSRMGGGMRAPKAEQRIEYVGRRISRAELAAFLEAHSAALVSADAARAAIMATQNIAPADIDLPDGFKGRLTFRTKNFLEAKRAPRGGRNAELFFAACDFKNNLFEMQEALESLLPVARSIGLSEHEARNTVYSAYKKASVRVRL